jgi:HEAT repeat protein
VWQQMEAKFPRTLCAGLLVGCGFLLIDSQAICGSLNESDDVKHRIETVVAEIKSESVASVRLDEANRLWLFVHQQERTALETLDNQSIDTVASLLEAKDVSVRSFGARILGDIGPRAERAIPALKDALTDVTPVLALPVIGLVFVGPSAICDIREALEKIEGKSLDYTTYSE